MRATDSEPVELLGRVNHGRELSQRYECGIHVYVLVEDVATDVAADVAAKVDRPPLRFQ